MCSIRKEDMCKRLIEHQMFVKVEVCAGTVPLRCIFFLLRFSVVLMQQVFVFICNVHCISDF